MGARFDAYGDAEARGQGLLEPDAHGQADDGGEGAVRDGRREQDCCFCQVW